MRELQMIEEQDIEDKLQSHGAESDKSNFNSLRMVELRELKSNLVQDRSYQNTQKSNTVTELDIYETLDPRLES